MITEAATVCWKEPTRKSGLYEIVQGFSSFGGDYYCSLFTNVDLELGSLWKDVKSFENKAF